MDTARSKHIERSVCMTARASQVENLAKPQGSASELGLGLGLTTASQGSAPAPFHAAPQGSAPAPLHGSTIEGDIQQGDRGSQTAPAGPRGRLADSGS